MNGRRPGVPAPQDHAPVGEDQEPNRIHNPVRQRSEGISADTRMSVPGECSPILKASIVFAVPELRQLDDPRMPLHCRAELPGGD